MVRSAQITEAPQPPTGDGRRRSLLGGDRFYTIARLLTVLLLFVCSRLLTERPIWPPFQLDSWLIMLIWGYAAFSLAVPALLSFWPTNQMRGLAFIGDVLIVSLLTYRAHGSADLFYPLYLLPLIGAAVQIPRAASLAIGALAMLAYGTAFLIGDSGVIASSTSLEMVALGLRAGALLLIPWISGELVERSFETNRESVAQATRQSEQAVQEAKTYREQMRSLYEVAFTLSTTMNYQTVLNVALVESRRLVSYSAAMVLLSTGHENELYIAAAKGLREDEETLRIQVNRGVVEQALRTGDPRLIPDISQEAELRSIETLQRCRSGLVVPLRAALQTYGVMLIASDQPGAFTQEHLGMMTALANYAIVALHNAQLIHDLRSERTKLISKEEEVRHQLARDLHDGPAQALAAIAMNIEFVKRLLERDPPRVLPELEKMGQLAKRTTYEVRTMLFELRPLVLETQGLDATLKQYFERFQSEKTKIVLEMDKITVSLDTKTEGTLFNIIQESVNNALKHAQAPHIWVRLRQTSNTLETTIQDDGRGFDLAKVRASYEQRGSFGLLNIEERAKLIGGFAEMHSAVGQGTTVRVIVPVTH